MLKLPELTTQVLIVHAVLCIYTLTLSTVLRRNRLDLAQEYLYTALQMARYDRAITVFSPDGHLYVLSVIAGGSLIVVSKQTYCKQYIAGSK